MKCELITDVLTAEDAGDAQFKLFLDTSGSKNFSFLELLQEQVYLQQLVIFLQLLLVCNNWCYYQCCDLMPKVLIQVNNVN